MATHLKDFDASLFDDFIDWDYVVSIHHFVQDLATRELKTENNISVCIMGNEHAPTPHLRSSPVGSTTHHNKNHLVDGWIRSQIRPHIPKNLIIPKEIIGLILRYFKTVCHSTNSPTPFFPFHITFHQYLPCIPGRNMSFTLWRDTQTPFGTSPL